MPKPTPNQYPLYFDRYISLVEAPDCFEAFKQQAEWIPGFMNSISEEQSRFAYAPGKWTIKELLQHIIDCERIFCYRALCIARKETVSLPGFDEDAYAAASNANDRTWKSLTDEFLLLRKTTEILFESFSDEALSFSGLSNNNPITVNSIGFILVGHMIHHVDVIRAKYLIQ
jgi:hypothetical protein